MCNENNAENSCEVEPSTGHRSDRERQCGLQIDGELHCWLRSRGNAGEALGVNQCPAMGSLADPDALVVDRGYGESKLVVINF
jgi:hypothetical protein